MRLSTIVQYFVAAILFWTVIAPPARSCAREELPAELTLLHDSRAEVTLLASQTIGESPDGNQWLTLSRVVLIKSDEVPIIIAGAEELWYAESGQIVLAGDSGEVVTASEGQQALLVTPGQYTVAFEGDNCPSALRLEFSSIIAMRLSSDETAPELGPNGIPCPEGETLLQTAESVSKRPVPAQGFIARLSLSPELFLGPAPFSGPVGYAVEAGSITFDGPETVNLGLTSGSWVSVATGQAHWILANGRDQTEVLMVGAFATDDAAPPVQPTPTPVVGVTGSSYLSPTFGFRLNWDSSWNVVLESTDAGVDTLHLSNGVSELYFQSYGAFTGDAITCVDGIAAQLPAQQGFSNVRPGETADGKPILTGDARLRTGVYDLTYTNESGVFEYTEYVECRMLPQPQTVLVITQIVLAESYPVQIEPVREILANLDTGSGG